MQRRIFGKVVGAAALGLALPARATTPASEHLVQHDLKLDGDARLARRALLLVPRDAPADTPLSLLVLLHGLGETGNEQLGIHAWGDRYGLVTSYDRLRAAPIARTMPRLRYLTDAHLTQLNASLVQRPFGPVALVCPVTPNPYKPGPSDRVIERYGDWLEKTLLPAVRERVNVESVGLDGCSLGGFVGIELFLRKPELFATFGGVQSAFSAPAALRYAERLAETISRVGPRPVRLGTSSEDPYRNANEAMSKRLHELGVPNVLSVLPGPHNQPWLREIGTLDMLLWHQRQLAR